jgi:hypothetical protein
MYEPHLSIASFSPSPFRLGPLTETGSRAAKHEQMAVGRHLDPVCSGYGADYPLHELVSLGGTEPPFPKS